ncbi:MAG: hypothetical protein JKX85_08525 [Phycisphaeraceae bacterium]|nr:hypothetical protein [Phycisphaeraceae bacterium]
MTEKHPNIIFVFADEWRGQATGDAGMNWKRQLNISKSMSEKAGDRIRTGDSLLGKLSFSELDSDMSCSAVHTHTHTHTSRGPDGCSPTCL